MICKLYSGIFSEAIVETFKEVSFAKDIGVIGNHDSSFAKESAMASDWSTRLKTVMVHGGKGSVTVWYRSGISAFMGKL